MVAFMFLEEDYAVLFSMASEHGRVLKNYAERVRREAALAAIRLQMARISAEERSERFPGFDEFVLANYLDQKAAA